MKRFLVLRTLIFSIQVFEMKKGSKKTLKDRNSSRQEFFAITKFLLISFYFANISWFTVFSRIGHVTNIVYIGSRTSVNRGEYNLV